MLAQRHGRTGCVCQSRASSGVAGAFPLGLLRAHVSKKATCGSGGYAIPVRPHPYPRLHRPPACMGARENSVLAVAENAAEPPHAARRTARVFRDPLKQGRLARQRGHSARCAWGRAKADTLFQPHRHRRDRLVPLVHGSPVKPRRECRSDQQAHDDGGHQGPEFPALLMPLCAWKKESTQPKHLCASLAAFVARTRSQKPRRGDAYEYAAALDQRNGCMAARSRPPARRDSRPNRGRSSRCRKVTPTLRQASKPARPFARFDGLPSCAGVGAFPNVLQVHSIDDVAIGAADYAANGDRSGANECGWFPGHQ